MRLAWHSGYQQRRRTLFGASIDFALFWRKKRRVSWIALALGALKSARDAMPGLVGVCFDEKKDASPGNQ
jgi:hypothetical protein